MSKGNITAKAAQEAAKKAEAEKAAAERVAAEAETSTEKNSVSVTKVPALRVVSSREGFRRGGRVWGKNEVVVKLSDLTDEQIAQIKGESLLTVSEIEVDEAAE